MASKKIIIILLFFFVHHASAHIYTNGRLRINFDSDDLERIGMAVVEAYFHRNLIRRSRFNLTNSHAFWVYTRKISINILQLLGITISLVSANILTSIYQQNIIHFATQQNFTHMTSVTSAIPESPATQPRILLNDINKWNNNDTCAGPSQLCPYNFGCDNNLCWRSCKVESKNSNANVKVFCYTTANPITKKLQQCVHLNDCSSCFHCVGLCHVRYN